MRLLYCYAKFLDLNGKEMEYRGLKRCELNFATDAVYHYDDKENRILRKDAARPLPDGFWGENIYNFTTISGKNGSGKTTILCWLRDMLTQLYYNNKNQVKSDFCVLLFEDVLNGRLQHIAVKLPGVKKHAVPVIRDDFLTQSLLFPLQEQGPNSFLRRFRGTKLMYLTNTFCEKDYYRTNRIYEPSSCYAFPYDRSIGGALHEAEYKSVRHMLDQYFSDEQYKQIEYLFDERQRDILNELENEMKDIHAPRELYIRIGPDSKVYAPYAPQQIRRAHRLNDTIEKNTAGQPRLRELWRFCCTCLISFMNTIDPTPTSKEDQLLDYTVVDDEFLKIAGEPGNYRALYTWLRQAVRDIKKKNSYDDSNWNKTEESYFRMIRFIENEEYGLFTHFKPASTGFSVSIPEILSEKKLTERMIEFISLYRDISVPLRPLGFKHGLSSGEDNMLRLFSSFFHVLSRNHGSREALYNVIEGNHRHNHIPCNSVLIFMDEADLTFHPEWQRRLIRILTAFLPRIYQTPDVKDIQVVLTSHSPLLLGDMPPGNVTYVPTNESNVPIESFGENIHMLFRNSFYLESTLGEFASKKIGDTAKRLMALAEGERGPAAEAQLEECRKIVQLVAPGPIRARLEQLVQAAEEYLGVNSSVEMLVQRAETLGMTERCALIERLQRQNEAAATAKNKEKRNKYKR